MISNKCSNSPTQFLVARYIAVQGAPAWPTRSAWQPIRNGGQTIIASAGLTDPFGEAEGPNVGFAVETAVATTEPIPATAFWGNWLLKLAQVISNGAASDGKFHLRHAKFGVFLYGLRNVDGEEFNDWVDKPSGDLGCLIGLQATGHAFR